jgi:signal transduction histidine kinase/DNA-binding response OmpR family regulator
MSEILTAIIREIKTSGAWVTLKDGRRRWLPGTELYADLKPHDDFIARAQGLTGKEIPVIELTGDSLGFKHGIVSHVRAGNDPWLQVKTWLNSALKIMEITATTPSRAIGLISPGIRGEIRLDTLSGLNPPWSDFAVPLPGDEVAAFFSSNRIDNLLRLITLDYSGYIQSSVGLKDVLLDAPVSLGAASSSSPLGLYTDQWTTAIHAYDLRHIKSILIVDNDPGILQLSELFSTDYKVCACSDMDSARRIIDDQEFRIDLAILDLHLGSDGVRDFAGLSLGRHLKEVRHECAVVIITGAEIDGAHLEAFHSAGFEINDLIPKPFGFQELLRALRAARVKRHWETDFLKRENLFGNHVGDDPTIKKRNRLQHAVDITKNSIDADGVVFFSIHPISYTVLPIVFAGDPNKYSGTKQRLDRSPVRDVAIDGEELLENRASGRFPKHRWLYRAYRYESCIGVPVRTGRASDLAYCLFAFHSDSARFSQKDVATLHLAAASLQEILYSTDVEAELRIAKPFELMGKGYGSMAHDLTTVLSNEFAFQAIRNAIHSHNQEKALMEVARIESRYNRAKEIVKAFRGMASNQSAAIEKFPLWDAIQESVENISKELQPHDTSLLLAPYTGPKLFVRMRRAGLSQVLYNLLLNASEQIERLKTMFPNRRGELYVEQVLTTKNDKMPWAGIRVYDNGPGIHRRDFSRIFNIHYTTKPGGCGMGLDICRQIAETIEDHGRVGSISVKRSVLLCGSAFELLLPVEYE